MKKLLTILALIGMCAVMSAQLPIAKKIKVLGTISDKGIAAPTIVKFNATYADTLKSGDTLFYKIPIIHGSIGFPYVTQRTKLVANDTTATLTFWQSFDGVKWFQLNQVSSTYTLSAYSATIAKSTTTATEFSFWQNNIAFESQWLGVRFIAKTKSGFKTIYYGSIRYNKVGY